MTYCEPDQIERKHWSNFWMINDEKSNYRISMIKRIQKAFRRWRYEDNGYYQINNVILIQKTWRGYTVRRWGISFREQYKMLGSSTLNYEQRTQIIKMQKRREYSVSKMLSSESPSSYPKKTMSELYKKMLDSSRLNDEQRIQIIKMQERRQQRTQIKDART